MTKTELVGSHSQERACEQQLFSALGWTLEGQRVRQSSKTTWRRTVERKRNKAGESWEVAKVVEWDRKCWSENVMTLYTYWPDKK